MASAFVEFLITVGGVTSAIGVFDSLLSPKQKAGISDYIFGFHEVSFRKFEQNVISNLMVPLMKDGRIGKRRTLIYSCVMGIATMVGLYFAAKVFNDDLNVFPNMDSQLNRIVQTTLILLALNIPTAAFSAIFDFWSLNVTKKLFIEKNPQGLLRPLTLFADLGLSILPVGLAFGLMTILNPSFPNEGFSAFGPTHYFWMFFGLSILLSAGSVVFISLLQVAITTVGFCLRQLVRITQLNAKVAVNTVAYEHPFKFIGFITGLLAASVTLIAG